MDATPHTYALWHRSSQNLPPRPVYILEVLSQKVRVVDLCEGDRRNLKLREVYPNNLTPWTPPARTGA